MKSTINRFLAISVVFLTVLAFMNSDCQKVTQVESQDVEQLAQSDADFIQVSEKELKASKQKKQESSDELFRFPNVFDVFRTIF